jgi:hypothetical protein
MFLAAAIAFVPIACGDGSDGTDASDRGPSESRANDMTSAR